MEYLFDIKARRLYNGYIFKKKQVKRDILMDKKTVLETMVEMRELVLPNDANIMGNLLGGRLLHWVDVAGAMAASRHANTVVVTAAIDSVEFSRQVSVGEMIVLKAKLTWVGRTSMEVLVEACSENYLTGETHFTNRAYLTFVSIDINGKPQPVPGLILETEEEKKEYQQALLRREQRLQKRAKSKGECN